MKYLTLNDWEDYARISKTGLWKLEIENGIAVRMYIDAVMQHLMGVPDDLSPEECCAFFTDHIYPDDMKTVEKYFRELLSGIAEVEYRYLHPLWGEIEVRCAGKKVKTQENMVTLMGQHWEVSEVSHLEGISEWESQLLERNRDLEEQQKRTSEYYKKLLNMEHCGILVYTFPQYKIHHINAEALRVFGVQDIFDAQKRLNDILRKVKYSDVTIVDRLKELRNTMGTVDYECSLEGADGVVRNYLTRSEVFITPQRERSIVTTFLDISENKALKREKGIFDALSTDYTCVYYCDLERDTITVLKQDEDSNATVVDQNITVDTHSYSFCAKYYYDHFIIKESAPDFLQKMDADYLKEYLAHNRRFAYRFRTKPNPAGCENFEVQVAQIKDADSFCIVMGYRYIDDIAAEQELQKTKLEIQMTTLKNIHMALSSGAWNLRYNEKGELIEVNWSDTLRHMLGFSSTEDFPNTFETWSDRLHPEDKKRILERYA